MSLEESLVKLRDIVEPLEELDTTLVALTPQLAEHNRAMVEKHRLTFDMLRDPGNAYAAELGLRFDLPPAVKEVYDGFGIDLPTANGEDSRTLPIPARVVIDRDGVVRVADIDADYTRRPEPAKTLEDVRTIFG